LANRPEHWGILRFRSTVNEPAFDIRIGELLFSRLDYPCFRSRRLRLGLCRGGLAGFHEAVVDGKGTKAGELEQKLRVKHIRPKQHEQKNGSSGKNKLTFIAEII